MSEARCDLGPVLAPGVWAKLADPEKVQLLSWCGCRLFTDGGGWVARFKRGDRIRGPDRGLVLEQTRSFLEVSPGLWPLADDKRQEV
jgi:hypothetical protein